jgi:hypothetical protein
MLYLDFAISIRLWGIQFVDIPGKGIAQSNSSTLFQKA